MQFDRILMPTDFSDCANAALTHAVALARQFEAELHLLHVVVLHEYDRSNSGQTFAGYEELHRRMEEVASTRIQQLIDEREIQELTLFQAQNRGIAAPPAILEYAEQESIDLIVLGTHGRRGLRHFLLGSVAEEVVRSASCPVLTIRDEEEARRFHEIDRILVPFDFSEDSQRALETAEELAAAYDSQIDVVHVIVPSLEIQAEVAIWGPTFDFDRSAICQRAEHKLAAAIERVRVPVKSHVLNGHVAAKLTRFAEGEKVDLIVLASHGLSGLEHFLLGSVAEKIIRSASCPVLTLRRPAAS